MQVQVRTWKRVRNTTCTALGIGLVVPTVHLNGRRPDYFRGNSRGDSAVTWLHSFVHKSSQRPQNPCRHPPSLQLQRLTGMMPILHSPGLMMPGQLGPISRVFVCSLMIFFTRTCSHVPYRMGREAWW